MGGHFHCDTHNGLPRVWLGWGELKTRKPELQAIQDSYFRNNMPNYKFKHPAFPRRWYDVHLDVVRTSTRWFEWRIHCGEKDRLVLPETINSALIPSILHFIYTGDYSIDADDMNVYKLRECPSGCITCSQICQLLRYHLDMFIAGLQLGIVELQAMAFSRFRALMNTSPVWVLKYAVQAVYSRPPIENTYKDYRVSSIKGLMDYRPELVLPAVLRWCGYYRMNPMRISSNPDRWCGLQEFEDVVRRIPMFKHHMEFGLVLDTVDILPPMLKFLGKSTPLIALHRYDSPPPNPPPNTLRQDFYRSNYQYVTYLQPLPFRHFSEQLPSNIGSNPGSKWCFSSEVVSTPNISGVNTQSTVATSLTSISQIPVNEPIQNSQPGLAFVDTNDLDPALHDFDMDEFLGSILETSPISNDINMDDFLGSIPEASPIATDEMDTSDSSFVPMPQDSEFELDLDFIAAENEANPDGVDLTNALAWSAMDTDMSFPDYMSLTCSPDSDVTMHSTDSTNLQMPQEMDIDMGDMSNIPCPNTFDVGFNSPPEIDFNGINLVTSMNRPEEIIPMESMPVNPHMFQRPPPMSATIRRQPFDWSRATHSAVDLVETFTPPPAEVQPPPRYNLRSRGSSTASTVQPNKPARPGRPSTSSRRKAGSSESSQVQGPSRYNLRPRRAPAKK
ncbi:unnamed protein product [Penicillium salamii]|uniref:BTB domain-containing protein n=1 Tax=Penicillium salamii TaxID=1612424 RepID=A0A9W4JKS5_9EURO|nr:unnamed protein product [Penicillium salamii]